MGTEYEEISTVSDESLGESVAFPAEWLEKLGEPKTSPLFTESELCFTERYHKLGYTYRQILDAMGSQKTVASLTKAMERRRNENRR